MQIFRICVHGQIDINRVDVRGAPRAWSFLLLITQHFSAVCKEHGDMGVWKHLETTGMGLKKVSVPRENRLLCEPAQGRDRLRRSRQQDRQLCCTSTVCLAYGHLGIRRGDSERG